MSGPSIVIDTLPRLSRPVFIAGFDGWGNAMDVSSGMADYLIRTLRMTAFARLDADRFYRYDGARPRVHIARGTLKQYTPPGGVFYAAETAEGKRDVVVLRAHEPSLRWAEFADAVLSLCADLGVTLIVTLGSMYDSVLHTERLISGIASDDDLFGRLAAADIMPIDYQGPGAVHTVLQTEGQKQGFRCVSLWCHCPFYLENTVHYGLLASLAERLSGLAGLDLPTDALHEGWREVEARIEALIQEDPEVQAVVENLKETEGKGDPPRRPRPAPSGEKVINLSDFMEPK